MLANMDKPLVRESLGLRIAKERTKGWSLGKIAEETGISKPHICRVWNRTHPPGHATQLLLCRRFQIAKDSFYEYPDEDAETAHEPPEGADVRA